MTPQLAQNAAAFGQRYGKVRPQGNRAIVAGQRRVVLFQRVKDIAAIEVSLGKVRPQGNRAVVARQRRVVFSQS